MALTEAQKRAKKKWAQKNKKVVQRSNIKSAAKRFVKEVATEEEFQELMDLFKSENPNANK